MIEYVSLVSLSLSPASLLKIWEKNEERAKVAERKEVTAEHSWGLTNESFMSKTRTG